MKRKHFSTGHTSFFHLLAILSLFLIVACGGGGGGGTPTTSSGTPSIALSTDSIQFPNTVLERTADRAVTIQNTGTANLVINQIVQDDPLNAPFHLYADTCSGQTLQPQATCQIGIRFTPLTQDSFADTFRIPSNAGTLTFAVSGNGSGLNVTINKVDTSAHTTIKLIVSVTDKDNLPVTGLGIDDFTVLEETLIRDILNFNGSTAVPVSVVLALDFSPSILGADVLDNIRSSAKYFIDHLLVPDTDSVAVIQFGTEVDTRIVLTSLDIEANRNAIKDAIDTDPTWLGQHGTQLYAAAHRAVELLDASPATNRNVVIVVSDFRSFGDDEVFDDVIAEAGNKSVAIFTIGFGDVLTDIMEQMAEDTGGEWFLRPDTADLQNAYEIIAEILDNQYGITFETERALGSVNELTVIVDNRLLNGDDTVIATY
jgi:VWFA-related protein